MNADFTIQLGVKPKVAYYDRDAIEKWSVTLAETGAETMTGARLARVAKYLRGTFLLTYGDGVSDVNIRDLVAFHRSHGKLVTVTGVRPPSRFGEMDIKDNRVISFNEKPQVSQGSSTAGSSSWSRIPALSFGRSRLGAGAGTAAAVRAGRPVDDLPSRGFWQPMDTFREYELLKPALDAGEAPWKTWKD